LGDLSVKVPVQSNNEIGTLARAFNEMTAQLKLSNEKLEEYNHTLEQKVNQRTGELKATIDNMVDGLAWLILAITSPSLIQPWWT
jgi:HAMP domain-containing protein